MPTTDNRLLRRIIRDHKYRGTSAEETIRRWPSVRRGEEKWIFPFQENADAMFNSSLLFELGVMKDYADERAARSAVRRPEYAEAYRLRKFLSYFMPIGMHLIPSTSLLREFRRRQFFQIPMRLLSVIMATAASLPPHWPALPTAHTSYGLQAERLGQRRICARRRRCTPLWPTVILRCRSHCTRMIVAGAIRGDSAMASKTVERALSNAVNLDTLLEAVRRDCYSCSIAPYYPQLLATLERKCRGCCAC